MENKTIDELMERRKQIAEEVNAEDADLDALEAEARSINEEIEKRKANEAKRNEVRSAVANGEGKEINKIESEKRTMTLEEIRSSKEYINAYANYIKTGKDDECRSLLSENVSGGYVPVPTVTEERIRQAWNKLGILDLVKKTYVKGNLRIGFELSATGAVVHTEGTTAPDAETLTFGIVSMIPANIKKWIKISDEALDLTGEEFLNYVYDELTYRIAKKAQEELIAKIVALTASATSTAVGVGVTAGTPSIGVVAQAIGLLADNAANPSIVMNKGSWAQFKAAQYAGGFNVDPFEGLDVRFDNTLPTYVTTGTAGDTWMIVGDFGVGAQANFPNGEEIKIIRDDLSLAEADLVKFVGREYVALGIVSDHAFVKVTF